MIMIMIIVCCVMFGLFIVKCDGSFLVVVLEEEGKTGRNRRWIRKERRRRRKRNKDKNQVSGMLGQIRSITFVLV